MNINFNTNILGEEMSREFAEFVKNDQGIVFTHDSGKRRIFFDRDYNDFDQADIIQMGIDFGAQKERKKWNQPESFNLTEKYGEIFRKAIDEYDRESGMLNETVSFEKLSNGEWKITIKPTTACYLFNIAQRYGKMCKALEMENEDEEKLIKQAKIFWKTEGGKVEAIRTLRKAKPELSLFQAKEYFEKNFND